MLVSVACPSSRQCTAVDNAGREVTFAPATPAHAIGERIDAARLTGVGCPSLQQCTIAYKSGSNVTGTVGNRWGWGAMSETLFNTIVTPNAKQFPWNSCRNTCGGCGPDDSEFSNAQSNHPGGVNVWS